MASSDYLDELLRERDALDPQSHAYRLVDQEIVRLQASEYNGIAQPSDEGQSVPKEKSGKTQWRSYEGAVVHEEIVKLTEKVFIPVKEFPKFNFVGKLLGPRGNTLKRLQAATQTRMSVLGRGSTRDKDKEEELRDSGDPKYEHLKEQLHVLIEVEAPRSEAHARLAAALAEIKRYMVPENDEIRQEQMREMAMLKNMDHVEDEPPPQVPIGRGRARGRGNAAPTVIRAPPGGIPPGGAIIIHAPPPPGLIATARVPRMITAPRGGARMVPRIATIPRHGTGAPEQFVRYDEYDATYDAAYEGYPDTGDAPPIFYEYPGETVEYPAVSGGYAPTSSMVRRPEKRTLPPLGASPSFGGPGKRYRGPEAYGDVRYPAPGEASFTALGPEEMQDAYHAATMH